VVILSCKFFPHFSLIIRSTILDRPSRHCDARDRSSPLRRVFVLGRPFFKVVNTLSYRQMGSGSPKVHLTYEMPNRMTDRYIFAALNRRACPTFVCRRTSGLILSFVFLHIGPCRTLCDEQDKKTLMEVSAQDPHPLVRYIPPPSGTIKPQIRRFPTHCTLSRCNNTLRRFVVSSRPLLPSSTTHSLTINTPRHARRNIWLSRTRSLHPP
jgi:hypothetical protein